MAVTCTEEGRHLTAAVTGELDHHRAKEVMEELDRQIDAALPRTLTLDLGGTDLYRQLGHRGFAAGQPPHGPDPGDHDGGPYPSAGAESV